MLLFVFFLALSPRSTALALGSSGLALTYQRISVTFMLLFLFAATMTIPKLRLRALKILHTPLAELIIALTLLKLGMTLLNDGIKYLPYAIDDALMSIGIFIIFATFVQNTHMLRSISFVIVLSLVVTMLLGGVEYYQSKPLAGSFFPVNVQVSDTVIAGRVRDGNYRLQGLFDNPLTLAEFAVYAFLFALYSIYDRRAWKRKLAIFGALSAVILVLATDSRGAIIALLVGATAFYATMTWHQLSITARLLMLFIGVCLCALATYQAFSVVEEQSKLAELGQMWQYTEGERSAISRARQYYEIGAILKESSFMGVGLRQNYAGELDEISRLDNYYLRLLLEGGVFAIILFLSAIYVFFRKAVVCAPLADVRNPRALMALMTAFVSSFMVMKLFVSMPVNNVYLYLTMGALYGGILLPAAQYNRAPRRFY